MPKFIRSLPIIVGLVWVGVLFLELLNAGADISSWPMQVSFAVVATLAAPCLCWFIYDDYRLFTGRVS